uniref:Uncharacterized protein n=1 Tax=Anguilla anguilla TaxID=7936 RepID=A0A0E9TIZ5_ANGAN
MLNNNHHHPYLIGCHINTQYIRRDVFPESLDMASEVWRFTTISGMITIFLN